MIKCHAQRQKNVAIEICSHLNQLIGATNNVNVVGLLRIKRDMSCLIVRNDQRWQVL